MSKSKIRNQTEETADSAVAAETRGNAEKKKSDKMPLIIMTCISLAILVTAVLMIFLFIRSNPDLVHTNDQTVQTSQNEGFLNPDSIQKLIYDAKDISLDALPYSQLYIIIGLVFMAVIVISFIFVKIKEAKEDN